MLTVEVETEKNAKIEINELMKYQKREQLYLIIALFYAMITKKDKITVLKKARCK